MKIVKIAAKIFVGLVLLVCVGIFFGINWVNKNLESVINASPDRKYNVNFEIVDFSYLTRVIHISEVKISPVGPQEGVFVEGQIAQISLNKLNLWKLFLRREFEIKEMVFAKPELVVVIPKENPNKEKAGEGLKSLFGDILSRGTVENFEVTEAYVVMVVDQDQIGSLSNLNIEATELETDSLKWDNPIPFDYGRIFISIDSMDQQFPNTQLLKVGAVEFDTQIQQLKLAGLSLKFPEGAKKASTEMEFQVDLIEFELDSMLFSGLEASSNLYSDLDIRARKLELSGLVLDDFRDKHIPRPPDEVKPMFRGLVEKINFPLKLDTLRVRNSSIKYGESVEGKDEYWQFHLSDLNGDAVNITSIDGYQREFKYFNGNFTSKLDGAGDMTIDLKIPYDREEFDLDVVLANFPLPKINEILKPLMNGRIETGELVRLELAMHADSIKSTNKLRFDYTDLKFEVLQKNSQQKNSVMSLLTNIALNQSNLPGEKKYLTSEYITDRNRYRGPFHLIWKSTKEGMLTVVPGKAVRGIMNTEEK